MKYLNAGSYRESVCGGQNLPKNWFIITRQRKIKTIQVCFVLLSLLIIRIELEQQQKKNSLVNSCNTPVFVIQVSIN